MTLRVLMARLAAEAVERRQHKADEVRMRVVEMAEGMVGRGRRKRDIAGMVARKTGMSLGHVRRMLREGNMS
ncbi:MAG: hypothetical protein HQL56_06825 [Magnetococcales bacterium]|nr:hypothetical protein [Magnetococcales bacterium]